MGDYKIYVFDVDGVLADSRQRASEETINLLNKIAENHYIALVTGGSFDLVTSQVANHLSNQTKKKTMLFPQSAAQLWWYDDDEEEFVQVYSEKLSKEDARLIHDVIGLAITKFKIRKIYSANPAFPQIENRGAQITFAILGANAPLPVKKNYDPDQKKRIPIATFLRQCLPNFTVTIGGTTSIDISPKHVNKSTCISWLEHFGFKRTQMIAFADAFYPGGNDEPIKLTGIKCVPVKDPKDTLKKLRKWL